MKNKITKINTGFVSTCSVAVVLILTMFTARAQSPLDQCGPTIFAGFNTSFGMRSFSITSDIAVLNNLKVVQEGGSLGGVFGNNFWIGEFRAGLYHSNDKTPYSIDIVEGEGMINFYPANLFSPYHQHRFDFYLSCGGSMDVMKFYGNYLDGSKPQNFSALKQPYLGRISMLNVTAGAGIELRMQGHRDFCHFFAEIKQGMPVFSSIKREEFKNTSIKSITFVNIGVSYGLRK